jgi:hypothetical protein
MSEIDIGIEDTGEASEFASDCFRWASAHAKRAQWESAGNWQSAAQWIVYLDGRVDDLEALNHSLSLAVAELATWNESLRGQLYELEQVVGGR